MFSIDQYQHVHDLHDLIRPSSFILLFYLLQKPVLGIITSFLLRHICKVYVLYLKFFPI